MRVLHIDTEMTWRGGENQLRLLLEGLKSHDMDCHVAVRPGSAAASRLAGLANLIEVDMRGGFAPAAALKLSSYCQSHAIDVIDAHTSHAHSLGLLIKTMSPRTHLVVHRRVDYVPGRNLLNRWKYLTPKVDRFVAISHAIADVLAGYGIPRARISVARSAIDATAYRRYDRQAEKQALAAAYGLSSELVFLGNASAMTEQKGYDVLLRAARRLKDRGVKFHCFIAGDGHLRDALEKQRIALDLEYEVTFLGFIEDVGRFLSSLDVLAISSQYEGLGTIILDGIAAGLAVAGTRVGGIPEIIKHEATGLLSQTGDDASLASNLERLVTDSALRHRLATNAYRHIESEFSLAGMVGGNLDVYRELCGKP